MSAVERALHWRRPWLDPLVIGYSRLGNNGLGIAAAGCSAALALGAPERASAFAGVVFGTLTTNALVKQVVRRERPRVPMLIEAPNSTSFPSSHAAIAAAAAWVASGWVPALTPAFASLALLMGLSRIYLGVHHGVDVAAGFVLGSLIGASFLALGG